MVVSLEGRVELVDVGASRVTEQVACHEGAVWDLALTPDKKGLVTASADKSLKFWSFAVRKV